MEFIPPLLSFIGGTVLTVDSFLVKRKIRVSKGGAEVTDMLNEAGVPHERRPQPLQSEKDLQLWLADRTLNRTWWGFLLIAIGFFLEMVLMATSAG